VHRAVSIYGKSRLGYSVVLVQSWCARSRVLALCSVVVLRYRSGILPQHLDSAFDVSDALDVPALASTWPYDSVSRCLHFRLTDSFRSRFDLSSSTRRVRELDGTLGVVRRWCGRLRYVHRDFALDLLIVGTDPYLQLAVVFWLVSSRSVRCLLRHPYHLVSLCIRRHLHRFRGSNRPRRLSTPSARPYGLLAWFFDFARSF
jgi:hypothetical protein